MEKDIKTKFKNEIRGFFALVVFNIVIAALVLALGMSLGITQLLTLIETGALLPIPLLLIGPSLIAIAAGFYWIIKTAEILDGITDITTAYEKIQKNGDQVQITGLIIEMMAHYRSKQPTISKMTILGRIGGILFLLAGAIGLINTTIDILSSGILIEGASQLVGGIIAIGVGVASLIIARYFKTYSGVWDTRLQETTKIENTLQQQLEAT